MNQLERIQRSLVKKTIPMFEIGDTVRVHAKVVEGDKERIQVFEGVVIARKGARNSETFTVRKISYGVGVERIFPDNSPNIDKVEVIARGRVHQSRLYYLSDLSGKAARIKEREGTNEEAVAAAPEAPAAEAAEGAEGQTAQAESKTKKKKDKKEKK